MVRFNLILVGIDETETASLKHTRAYGTKYWRGSRSSIGSNVRYNTVDVSDLLLIALQ
jgi:hypothetical protein